MKPGKTYLCLGKLGDQLNLLPLLWADAQKGERPTLLVAKEYAGQLSEGCSYFDELVFDGPADEIKAAYNFAREYVEDEDVVVTQIVGKPEDARWAYGRIGATHAQTDSFAKEAYLLAGRLNDWGKYPLVFDKKGEGFCPDQILNTKPAILVSAGGATSPFAHKDLLFESLRMKFPRFDIIDLETVKPPRIYDLLSLYERAHVLVASDSAPLHLAYACPNLPVVALVNDRPILWNGSPWRPNHIAHVRYGDFKSRILDIWEAIQSIGKSGSKFNEKLTHSKRLVHLRNRYEIGDEFTTSKAASTWATEHDKNCWIACNVEQGVFGRDSKHSQLKTEKRFPFLKDAIRMAARLARDEDIIVLTRPDTAASGGATERILASTPCYAHRKYLDKDQHDPSIDLIAFPKSWWRANHAEIPDLVWNNDQHWSNVLVELLKASKAVEIKDAIYRA